LNPSTTPISLLLAATDTSQAVAVVKQAVAKANSVPAPAVLSAMLDLEAAKLPVSLQDEGTGLQSRHTPSILKALVCLWTQVEGWQDVLQAPGTHWRLVFTSGAAESIISHEQLPQAGQTPPPHARSQGATAPASDVVCSVMHVDEKDVKAAMKKQPNKGGIYFPIAAVQVRPPCQQPGQHMDSICRSLSTLLTHNCTLLAST
jgi:hypothetical protein